MLLTRRKLLRQARLLPLAAIPATLISACATDDTPLCADPELLTRGEAQMRVTLAYVEVSADDNSNCTNCQFFKSSEHAGCGECELLAGSVNAHGYCTSWAKKN